MNMAEKLNRSLKQRLADLRVQQPRIRARNAAQLLGVTEAELVASHCGDSVIRLRNDYKELLESLVKVGQVMTITRNEHVVHEKFGYYSNLQLKDHGGGAFDHNINLRIYFDHWAHVFVVIEGGRHSIQVFDNDGTAVHKIYLTENSNEQAWNQIVEQFCSDDQSTEVVLQAVHQPYQAQNKNQVNAANLMKQWREITDLHQFWFMLRDYQLTRLDALHLVDEDLARRVDDDAWRNVLEQVRDTGLSIMVFVRSPGVAQIHTGPIHKLLDKDGWFNVLDPTFNLHLRSDSIAQTWVVYRPTENGGQTSLEMYDADGELVFHLFGEVNLHAPELPKWRALLHSLPSYKNT